MSAYYFNSIDPLFRSIPHFGRSNLSKDVITILENYTLVRAFILSVTRAMNGDMRTLLKIKQGLSPFIEGIDRIREVTIQLVLLYCKLDNYL